VTRTGSERPESFLRRLVKLSVLHHLVRVFRVQALVHGLLTRFPLVRTLPRSGGRYRVQHLESFVMADEIFGARCYADAFEPAAVRSFIDVGCNVGYFVCFAADVTRNRVIVGLAVDASPAMVEETRWHVDINGLTRVAVAAGVVGFGPEVEEVTFFAAASNVASSAQPRQNPRVPEKGMRVETRLPTIQLLSAWREHAGEMPVDLLKIDVEGSELDVIRTNSELLGITRAVVLEWHNWVVKLEDVQLALGPHGFHLSRIISEDEDAGVGLFVRR
jgi:FkbM family methyltransferase